MPARAARRVLATVAPFSPRQLGQLSFDLDASRLVGLVNGDPIVTFSDTSGKARHGTQATGAARALYRPTGINGEPAAQFDGVDDFYTIAGATAAFSTAGAATTFMVYSIASDTQYTLYHTGGDGQYDRYGDTNSYVMNWQASGTRYAPYEASQPTTGVHQKTVVAATTYQEILDGVKLTLKTGHTFAPTGADITVASGDAGYGDLGGPVAGMIARFIAYTRKLTANEILRVERYLSSRYGTLSR